jgi:enterochelin esterase-like enzyme
MQVPPFNFVRLLKWSFYFLLTLTLSSCDQKTQHRAYEDLTHHSKVFSRDKYYRLYLPDDYNQSGDRYPVIYFFHGWGGRYKSDDNANLAYEKLKDLVNKYRVILVMWDGNIAESNPRPYNVGNHENIDSQIQMKDYFPELTAHIDSTYRTLTDKNHRGIIGFSMGGFMSWFLAGKYPDKVGAAVYMTGSPEFFAGTPDNHTLYPVRYAFKNLREVQLRHHNSTKDELNKLNSEVHAGALWDGHLHYEYWVFDGGHMVDVKGKTDVFEKAMKFVVDAFSHPLPEKEKWCTMTFIRNLNCTATRCRPINLNQVLFISMASVKKVSD